MGTKDVALQVRVEESLSQRVSLTASVLGLSVSQLLRSALDDFLQNIRLDEEAIARLEREHQEKLAALAQLRDWQRTQSAAT